MSDCYSNNNLCNYVCVCVGAAPGYACRANVSFLFFRDCLFFLFPSSANNFLSRLRRPSLLLLLHVYTSHLDVFPSYSLLLVVFLKNNERSYGFKKLNLQLTADKIGGPVALPAIIRRFDFVFLFSVWIM